MDIGQTEMAGSAGEFVLTTYGTMLRDEGYYFSRLGTFVERAAEDAGGVPERQAVVEEVFATEDYEGVLGTWSFDEDGDTSLTELSIQTVENGEFKLDRVVDVADL